MDYFQQKCRDYKDVNTLKIAQWWEKGICGGIWEKKWWCGNFMMLIRKNISNNGQNKKSVLRKVQVKWMTMMTNERFDLVVKDELGIWKKGAEEKKNKASRVLLQMLTSFWRREERCQPADKPQPWKLWKVVVGINNGKK